MSSWYSPQKPTCPLKNDGWKYVSFWNGSFSGDMLILIFGGVGGYSNGPDWWQKNKHRRRPWKVFGIFLERREIRAIEHRQLLCVAPVCRMNEWYRKIYPTNAGILGNPWKTTRQMDFPKSSCNIYWVHFAVCWINHCLFGKVRWLLWRELIEGTEGSWIPNMVGPSQRVDPHSSGSGRSPKVFRAYQRQDEWMTVVFTTPNRVVFVSSANGYKL